MSAAEPLSQRSSANRLFDLAWFLTFACASSAFCLETAARVGLTFDENNYLEKGLLRLRTGSADPLMRMGTMPLPVDVQFGAVRIFELVRDRPVDPRTEAGDVIVIARVMNLVFWWLLLFYSFLIGRSLAGPWAGRAAVAFVACEPSLLAHASLATTDLSVAACLLAMAYHARAGRGSSSWIQRVAVPGLWAGAALLAKASALVFGPILYAAIEIEHRLRDGVGPLPAGVLPKLAFLWRAVNPFRRDWILAGLIAVAVTVLYIGSDFQPEPSFVKWADAQPDGPEGNALRSVAHNLRIFPNAFNGLAFQLTHNVRGHGSYLLGVVDRRALWWYFPVLATIKISTGVLIALALSVLVAGKSGRFVWPLLGAALLLLASPAFRVQLGIRMILPVVALSAIGSAATLLAVPSRLRAALLVALCALNAFDAVRVFPNTLCHVNTLWGGTEHGYKLVSDSNYDWGQGIPALDAWQRRRGVDRIAVWYFGTDPRAGSDGRRVLPLHTLPAAVRFADLRALVPEGRLAVSTTLLYGPYIRGKDELLADLRAREPADRTATFLIYDLQSTEP